MTGTGQRRTNPYVGPRAFQPGEKLYGRDREVTQLLHLLMAERIVLFYSPSGAGKTSLIQASLIPELEREGFYVLPPMRVSQDPPPDERMEAPCNRYVLSLLLSLEEALPQEQRTPLAELSTLTLSEYLDGRRGGEKAVGTLLVFDQFEEILTLDPTDRELKLEFFAQVGEALRNRRRWALFAMREEFLAGLEDAYRRPIPTRLRTGYRLDLLGPRYARQAIQGPAKTAGVTFTDAAADKLVGDLSTVRVLQPDGSMAQQPGSHVEPVQLQVVCRRLWDLLPHGASHIVEEDIGLLTEVDLALSGYYADQVRAAASATRVAERTIRDWFDRELITEQGIRGQVLEGPTESEGLDNRAIDPLVNAHLVRAEKRRGVTWFELAHDRLIEPVQADNAAWRRARRNRWIAAMAILFGIVAISLALVVGSIGGRDAAREEIMATAGEEIMAAQSAAALARETAVAADGTAIAAGGTAVAAQAMADQERDAALAAKGTAVAAQGTATSAGGTAIAAERTASAALSAVEQEQAAAEAARATSAAAEATAAYLAAQLAACEATDTPTPTGTPAPTATPTPTQSPTARVTVVPACSVEARGTFAVLWRRYRTRLGCPLEATPSAIRDAEQAFENGRMFWRADNRQIYVVYEQGEMAGEYETFRSGWPTSGEPVCSYPCEAAPPGGFYAPVRGFRVVWCRLCAEDAAIGWGIDGERGYGPAYGGPLVQDFEGGTIFRDSAGRVYVLLADGVFGQDG